MSVETRTFSLVPPKPPAFSPIAAAPGIRSLDLSPLLIGPSPAVGAVWEQMRRVAPHFRMLLVSGEPGTGAEAAARILHDLCPIAHTPFHAFSAEEAEATFVGATQISSSAPAEGTIFLREAERLSRAAQAGLLRYFYTRATRSLRVIASARTGLRPLVSTGSFSPELAAALGAVRVCLPTLRQRPEDIPLLIQYFLERHSAATGASLPPFDPEFLPAAAKYDWPGNLDQMESVLRTLVADAGEDPLSAAALGDALATDRKPLLEPPSSIRLVKLDQVIQEHIRGVLLACNGNKLRAAQVLGISRSTLYRMLDTPSFSSTVALAS